MNSLYTVKWVTYNGTVQCRHCYGMDELVRQMLEFVKVPVYRIEVWSKAKWSVNNDYDDMDSIQYALAIVYDMVDQVFVGDYMSYLLGF